MRGGNYWILYHKTNKEASTVLCSVVNHLSLRNWQSTQEVGKLLSCSTAFGMLYSITEYSQGFFIC